MMMFFNLKTPLFFLSLSSYELLGFSLVISTLMSNAIGVVGLTEGAPVPEYTTLNPSMSNTRGKEIIFPPNKLADITLGGLFPVHQKLNTIFGQSCGELDSERGIHRLEAMLYAVAQVNENTTLLPNITLGANIHDTCGQDTIALEESLEFVTEKLMRRNPIKCQSPEGANRNQSKIVAGVIGAASSTVSIQVANLLRLFKMPQISYASTSPDLSNKYKYDYFVRTVPPDTLQARAMVDIIVALNWTSVFTVHSHGNYAERGIEKFLTLAKAANICTVSSGRLSESPTTDEFDVIIQKFIQERNTRGVVLFCNDNDIRQLLEASARAKAVGRFVWIGSEFWGTRRHPVEDIEDKANGAITVRLKSVQDVGFREYFTNLTPEKHSKVNPWFNEFWGQHFNCTISSNSSTCPKNATLEKDMYLDDKVPFVIDAVNAFANAFHRLYVDLCPSMTGLCPAMKLSQMGPILLEALRNTSFEGASGRVRFDVHGDSSGRYDIFRFIRGDYIKVASWDDKLVDVSSLLYKKDESASTIESYCSVPCGIGYYRELKTDKSCCWSCKPCGEDEYVQDYTRCTSCPIGETSTLNRTTCRMLDLRYISSNWTIMVTCIAGIGIVCTCLVAVVFVRFSDTPLVKASGRELTFMLLLGLLLCYGVGIALVLHPSTFICYIQRGGVGFCVCVCYSALLIKTNRIARIFKKSERSTRPPGFINPLSQLAILAALVGIEMILAGIGIVTWPPKASRMYPTKTDMLLTCNIQNYDLMVALLYNMLLIFLCTWYAFKTRKTPANFNEARYIGFATYTTCVIWLTFLPVQFGVNDKDYKTITLSVNITLNATTLLLCVFGPKIYILIFRPTRNVRSRSQTTWRTDQDSSTNTGRTKSDSELSQVELGFDNPVGVKEKEIPHKNLPDSVFYLSR
ncbi:metabotropic glutamate receptor 3-like [Actinia tenebrosa]|uniref:Metabotropic glutamate receptor 3-like n=1 Tax=Actinia tenebrosa TaxID=6105 RepID=A0A6P8IIT7_ACTTE|nr:metabotropic glutamate receptor 3-like [Actinia tenebrosa]XP_031566717.1 metabotropic glutamate receptor 3-like [Actinia tenebrosa]